MPKTANHDHVCTELTPEQDAAIAVKAIAEGDLGHAAIHVAGALSFDPLRADHRALFETWYAASTDPLGQLPLGEGTSYSIVSLHAEVLARKGRHGEALDLLFRAAAVRLDVPFLAWGLEWFDNDALAASIDLDPLEIGIQQWASALGRNANSAHPRTIEAGLSIIEKLRAAKPQHIGIGYWHIAALRGLKRIPEALAIAEALYAAQPAWRTALAVGMVLRRTSDFDGAVAMFRKALTHDPEDLGCRLDLGDMLCDAGRLDEGIVYYQEVLDRKPADPWALPSSYFFRAIRDNDSAAAESLRLMTFNDPDNQRAAALAERLPAIKSVKKKPSKKKS